MAAVRRRKGAAGTRSEAGEAGKADGRRGASSGGGREARPLRITTWTLPYPVGVTCTDMPTMWIRRRDFVGSRSSIPFLLEGVRRRRARPRPSNLGSPLVQSRPYPAPIPPRPVFVSPTCPFISCPCRRFPSPLSLPFLHVLTTAGAPRHPCPLRSPHGAVVDARTAGVFACRRRGRGGGRGECRPLWRLGALPRAVGSQGRRGGEGAPGGADEQAPFFRMPAEGDVPAAAAAAAAAADRMGSGGSGGGALAPRLPSTVTVAPGDAARDAASGSSKP